MKGRAKKRRESVSERAHDILRHTPVNPLDALFSPRTVAIIGASAKAGSVGRALTENLRSFAGTTYLVNPHHARILDVRTFPNLDKLPEQVELAIIATPAPTVPGLIRECVKAGVRAAIILSAGFKECGPAGRELEEQILQEAQAPIAWA